MESQALRRDTESFDRSLIPHIEAVVPGRLKRDVPGASLTTFAVGGPIRAVITVETVKELAAALRLLSDADQEVRTLGNGSNVLVSDEGLDGWVIRLGAGFRSVTWGADGVVEVGGATSLMSFARKVSDDGWAGLEFAAGIPASLGGAAFMNAGAHGSELCERVVQVRGVSPEGAERVWERNELPWRYRSSGLPTSTTVTSVVLKLTQGDRSVIAQACAENLAERRARQPLALPSAGSVFKNPRPDLPAGRVLEEAGLKGERIGGAVVSELHANWIVNPERRASARDIRSLIELCRERVLAACGISLEPEVRFWL